MHEAAYESFERDEKEHFWFVGRRRIFTELLDRYCSDLDPKSKVFDVGCGVGGMLGVLADYGKPIGMDLDRGSLALCQRRGFRRVAMGRGGALPLCDTSISLATLFDTLEHIPEERETLLECHRVLVPGGRMIISGPAYQFLYTHQDRIVDHQRRYTLPDLERRVSDAGFEVLHGSYINCFLFPLILPTLLFRKAVEKLRPPGPEDTRLNTEIAMPTGLNKSFTAIFSAERRFVPDHRLPFGHSLVVVARKAA